MYVQGRRLVLNILTFLKKDIQLYNFCFNNLKKNEYL